MIKVLCADADEKQAGKYAALIRQTFNATVDIETDGDVAAYLAERREYDAILTVPRRGKFDGLKLARYVHDVAPQTKVIFIADTPDYAVPAFKTRACGYLLAPITTQDLIDEFSDLDIGERGEKHVVEAKVFGNFELLCDGEAIKFSRAKTKELVAYLIDRRCTAATSSELIVNLYEDKDVDRTTRSMLHNLIADARKVFSEHNISNVLDFKHNAFRIDDKKIVCDYYDLLDGKRLAKNKFMGEYMAAYPWAEVTSGNLADMTGRY